MPLDISEYVDMAVTRSGAHVPACQEPALVTQQVAIGAEALQSAAFNDATRFVRLHADAACRFAIGKNPVATGASARVPAGGTEVFGVLPGHKISVIESE